MHSSPQGPPPTSMRGLAVVRLATSIFSARRARRLISMAAQFVQMQFSTDADHTALIIVQDVFGLGSLEQCRGQTSCT